MRIAQVAPVFESVPPARYGGTERVVAWLCEELCRRGHDVTLFATGDSVTSARLSGTWPHALRPSREPFADPSLLHAAAVARAVDAQPPFDVIHTHVDWVGPALAQRSPVPILTTMHFRLDTPEARAMAEAFPSAPLVAISRSQRAALPHASWQATIHHGLPPRSIAFREHADGYVLFLGRLSRVKRPDVAIRAARLAGVPLKIAAKVRGNGEDCRYWDEVMAPLLASHGDGVELLGEVGDDEKSGLVGGARAVLFPADWPEPFGLVAIESLAAGSPVIAFPNGALPEIVEGGRNGFLVRSVEEMAGAIRASAAIDRRRCRESFERRFTVERMVDEYEQVYERLARGGLRELGVPERPADLSGV